MQIIDGLPVKPVRLDYLAIESHQAGWMVIKSIDMMALMELKSNGIKNR